MPCHAKSLIFVPQHKNWIEISFSFSLCSKMSVVCDIQIFRFFKQCCPTLKGPNFHMILFFCFLELRGDVEDLTQMHGLLCSPSLLCP
jgi:hypothetical protein